MTNYNGRKAKSWRTRRYLAGGGSVLADAEPLRPIILELRSRMSWPAVARLCGTTSHRHVREIADGTIRRVNHDMAANIRAAAGRTLDDGKSLVTALGARRRMQALMALGYSAATLSTESGYTEGNMKKLVRGDLDVITAATHKRMRDTFDRLCMTPPVARNRNEKAWITRNQNRAEAAGWPVPLAWDCIDDPREKPSHWTVPTPAAPLVDEEVVRRLIEGKRLDSTADEKREAMRRWIKAGKSERSLCELHGWRMGRYTERSAA